MNLYQYIINNTANGKIDKNAAIDILAQLKLNENKINGKEDIAITGIAVKLSNADNVGEYWDILKAGADGISEFPARRRGNLKEFMDTPYAHRFKKEDRDTENSISYSKGSFLNEIDEFDYAFFGISPREANLMDPNQRLFLQAAWQVIEDAGYDPAEIAGSNLGVYAGFSSDFGESYKRMLEVLEPDSAGLATSGNIRSIIASRISYLLDLKGPSMLVDTACSSSLVAVSLACQAIRAGQCDAAIAGGIKLNLLPIDQGDQIKIGIESAIGKTRTFDDASDGTGFGEGVLLIYLKPLKKALANRDHIYALIKGSATNQDGNSIGITAPNSLAQEDVLIRAWKDAGIEPETLSYIEAHGTGTNLGDPIEIEGISRAFRKYTTKKQFCAIGSVKSNIGHLDHAAGIAGLVKAALALNHRMLPPTIHFNRPNRNIDFEDSPVYVNDRLTKWDGGGESALRCGVNSFGLSGTNCHVVLEEAPKMDGVDGVPLGDKQGGNDPFIFTASAKSKDSLIRLLSDYKRTLTQDENLSYRDVCYTASARRGHYNIRIAIIARNCLELLNKLKRLQDKGLSSLPDEGIYFGEHKVRAAGQRAVGKGEISRDELDRISQAAEEALSALQAGHVQSLEDVAAGYIQGANLDWKNFYKNSPVRSVSLPVYSFSRTSCWIGLQDTAAFGAGMASSDDDGKGFHPLFNGVSTQVGQETVYTTMFSSTQQWVVGEHKVFGKYVPPGTAYVEMALAIGSRHFGTSALELRDVVFVAPMIIGEHESREVKATVTNDENALLFTIESRSEEYENWTKHAEGKVARLIGDRPITSLNIDQYSREHPAMQTGERLEQSQISLGPRWKNLQKVYKGPHDVLALLELHGKYAKEAFMYHAHPALLDMAVNILNGYIGNGLFLPFSYKNFKLYAPVPPKFYSYISSLKHIETESEAATFDIVLLNSQGEVFAEITGYTIKKVDQNERGFERQPENRRVFHQSVWIKQAVANSPKELQNTFGTVLMFKEKRGIFDQLAKLLKIYGGRVIEVERSNEYRKLSDDHFMVPNTNEGFKELFTDLSSVNVAQIIYGWAMEENREACRLSDLENMLQTGTLGLFHCIQALLSVFGGRKMELLLLSEYAYAVKGDEKIICPHNASFLGLGRVIGLEYTNISVTSIDLDDEPEPAAILREWRNHSNQGITALRKSDRYISEITSLNLEDRAENIVSLSGEGAYLITGGTGGIGIELVKHLSKHKVNLCLIGRSAFKPQMLWDEQNDHSDRPTPKIIEAVREAEKNGSRVKYFRADVSNEHELSSVLSEIRAEFGKINGVFHAAGVAGDGFLIRKEEQQFKEVLAPKVQGTWLLDHLTREDRPDLFVLFSSVTSLTGEKGQGDYTAANAYLDAFGEYRSGLGLRTLVINWAPWLETGMAFEMGALRFEGILKPIPTRRALDALDKVLVDGGDKSRLIIGEMNLRQKPQDERLARKERFNVALEGKNGAYTEMEKRLAQIVGNALGLEIINIFDSFHDMGADSIMAGAIVRAVDEDIPGAVSIADFYTYPSIEQLAAYIDRAMESEQADSSLEHEEETVLKQLLGGLRSRETSAENILELLDSWGSKSDDE
ncbi:SDR family NAD(P)-dependent oxidoreductase [Paenibacillus sp.]|jgi:polyketide synthase PksN|uniref:type I polyketide synthase n=1 Tax=Paenibacillus sp. TaxID=58172 RepID=UPI00283233FD|nr:SDR family NAD(P)-dependent oxidoreductase [Paenibacillus sp.]MDR0268477.1 SDR family NAD(P)-dependent oxidoreductase [Paenibacillus sp.]